MARVEDFFIASNSVENITEDEYKDVDVLIKAAEAISRATYQSVYIIDYFKQCFLYVSENPLFLCGHTAEEVKELGYNFYIKNVPEEEQKMLVEINRSGFKFFDTIQETDRHKCFMTYDFHIINNNRQILINHKLTPILLNKSGKIWIAMCVVSISSHKSPGHIQFNLHDDNKYWKFSLVSHKWKEEKRIVLKPEEKEVLLLSSKGCTMDEIAEKINKSVDTVKFYKKKIFEEMGVKNITEALSFATIYKLL